LRRPDDPQYGNVEVFVLKRAATEEDGLNVMIKTLEQLGLDGRPGWDPPRRRFRVGKASAAATEVIGNYQGQPVKAMLLALSNRRDAVACLKFVAPADRYERYLPDVRAILGSARLDDSWRDVRSSRNRVRNVLEDGNPFSAALPPVSPDEPDSTSGEYFKLAFRSGDVFGVCAADGWECHTWKDSSVHQITPPWGSRQSVDLHFEFTRNRSALEILEAHLQEVRERQSAPLEDVWVHAPKKRFRVGGADCAAYEYTVDVRGKLLGVNLDGKWRHVVMVIRGKQVAMILEFGSSRDDFDDYKDDVYAIFGSARVLATR
jgi:hypothetical protein